MSKGYNQCKRCVMDTTAADIQFDEQGVCNYCSDFVASSKSVLQIDRGQREQALNDLVQRIKQAGQGRKYDCIVGVSGGVDSSWVLVQAVKLGLRPLAVHMDNGWNSELAQNNIENLVRKLNVELFTYVIDWNEYRSLMQSFFDADVVDVELLYDNAMLAVNYSQAEKYGIKYIAAGTNQATEGMKIPSAWNWFKFDKKNIKSIGRRFGAVKLNSFPAIGVLNRLKYRHISRINWVSFLDYLDYRKDEVLKVLVDEYNYKPYPYKHYESIFTRFYQGYILPTKFGIDKRKLHLSNLIVTGQMQRQDAVLKLGQLPYGSESELKADMQYFLKKMKWTQAQLDTYLARPPVPHSDYPSEKGVATSLTKLYRRYFKWLSRTSAAS